MDTRKPRVFVASTFKGFEHERRALERIFEKYQDSVDFSGYETWRVGVAPVVECRKRASGSDYLILLLGGRYGTRDKRNNKSITQNEYEEFLYSHAVECAQRGDPDVVNPIQVFEKDPARPSRGRQAKAYPTRGKKPGMRPV